jgi:hypothetical protein
VASDALLRNRECGAFGGFRGRMAEYAFQPQRGVALMAEFDGVGGKTCQGKAKATNESE